MRNTKYLINKFLLSQLQQKELLIECARALYADTKFSWWRQLAKGLNISEATVRKFLSNGRPSSIPPGIWCDIYEMLEIKGSDACTELCRRMRDIGFVSDFNPDALNHDQMIF